jgi:hypothetical protein
MRDKRFLGIILVILLSSGFMIISVFAQRYEGENTGGGVSKEKLLTATEVLANNEAKLMRMPGVVGVGIGLTEEGDQPAIHVFIDVGATGGALPTEIPKRINNVPVRVIQTDQIKAR